MGPQLKDQYGVRGERRLVSAVRLLDNSSCLKGLALYLLAFGSVVAMGPPLVPVATGFSLPDICGDVAFCS